MEYATPLDHRAAWPYLSATPTTVVLLLKNLLFTILVPGFVVGCVPHFFLMRRPVWPEALGIWHWTGLAIFALGSGVYLHCVWHFARNHGTPAPIDEPKKLVHRGLYRWVRNPMYLGILTLAVGEAVFWQRPVLAFYTVVLACVFHLFVVLYEENNLRRRFGAEYGDYLYSVPRWLPRKPKPRLVTIAPFEGKRP